VLGVRGVADTLRETCDHGAPIAKAVGIDEVRAELLPGQKLAAFDELAASHPARGRQRLAVAALEADRVTAPRRSHRARPSRRP